MPVGGKPARKSGGLIVTFAKDGRVVGSFSLLALAVTCCTLLQPTPPITPQPEPVPPVVVVDASQDAVDGDGVGDASELPPCRFREPRARSGRRVTPRIVGGSSAESGEFPFAVSINDGSLHYCGGSVIADRWVLTAAHCQVLPGDIARVGNVDRRFARQIRIVESRIHADYDPGTFKNDIALARLADDAGVPVVRFSDGQTSNDATVIGWGRLSEGGGTTNHLQKVNVPIIPLGPLPGFDCRDSYPEVDESQVCADTGGAGSCQGDSGSALLQFGPSGIVQLGVVSYGRGCARPLDPGVYTRVSKFVTWIASCSR